jgi:N-acetylmuramoyl-L-alanine amidase
MATSPDHPELIYLEARQTDGDPAYTVGRPDGKPLWIVIHDMEATERPTCAEDTANYFHTGAGGRSVSSHYCVDDNSVIQCVLLKHCAWTVGNRPGNNRGINWELCGFASQSRAQWLDNFGMDMFQAMAPIVRSDAAKYNIPIEHRSVSELKQWKPGVTSHNDLRLAFGGTTHTDPGANFPWDVWFDIMLEDDMALTPADANLVVDTLLQRFLGSSGPTVGVALQTGAFANTTELLTRVPVDLPASISEIETGVETLLNQPIDIPALAAAIAAALPPCECDCGDPAAIEAIIINVLNQTKLMVE